MSDATETTTVPTWTSLPEFEQNRTTSPIRYSRVEHAAWCDGTCWDDEPGRQAIMLDERRVIDEPTLIAGRLADELLNRIRNAGGDVRRAYIRHPGYGPEMYLRSCEVSRVQNLLERLDSLINECAVAHSGNVEGGER